MNDNDKKYDGWLVSPSITNRSLAVLGHLLFAQMFIGFVLTIFGALVFLGLVAIGHQVEDAPDPVVIEAPIRGAP